MLIYTYLLFMLIIYYLWWVLDPVKIYTSTNRATCLKRAQKNLHFYISQSLAVMLLHHVYSFFFFFFFGGGPIARSSCVLLLFFLFEEYGTFIRVYHLPRWGGAGNYPLIHRFMNVARAPLHSNHMNGDQRKSHDTVTTAKNKLQEKLTIWHANPRLLDVEIFLNMVRFATALMWWR